MSTSSQVAGVAGTRREPAAHSKWVLLVLTLAAFMASLDVFIVNVAFDAIGADFRGASLADLSWVLNAYAIVFAAFLVPAGRFADRFGRRRGFLVGLTVFTAASVGCALAGSVWALVGFRVLQAIGAAVLTPASLGLVIAAAPPEKRTVWVRIWAAAGAVAAAFGPAVGGVLVEVSWNWVFLVNVPIGLLALVGTWLWVEESQDASAVRNPDVLGALLLVLAIGALSLAIVEGPAWGWGSGRIVGAWVLAAVAMAGFLASSARHPVPVVSRALLQVRPFAWANVTALLFAIPFAAALLANILWMQTVWHYSAIQTGFGVAPGPLMVPLFAFLAARFLRGVPVGLIVAAGCVLFGLGGLVMAASVGATPDYVGAILPGWLIGGAGVGLALPNILSAATADLPAAQGATGSALVNMSRQIGTALGVSLLIAFLGSPTTYAAAHTAFQHAWWFFAGVAGVGALAAPFMTPHSHRAAALPVPAQAASAAH